MIISQSRILRLLVNVSFTLALQPLVVGAIDTSDTNTWSLVSPNRACDIRVVLDNNGTLTYEVSRDGKSVIQTSPMGLRRDDQDFEGSLTFIRAERIEHRREKYELFAGV